MAGPFVTDAGTEEVIVPCICEGNHDHDTITIRSRFSGGQISEIDSAMFDVSGDGNPRANMGAANRKMVEIAVMGWSFTSENGELIPFDPELVNMIDARAWAPLVEVLNAKLEAIRNPTTASGKPDAPAKRQRSKRS